MKGYINRFSMDFEAKSANEGFARIAISGFASQLDPTIDVLADVKTAVSEAVTNSIVHAYKNMGGKIKLTASYDEKRVLTVIVKDKGLQPLYTTDKSGERSGMGFAIMESFMDSLKVSSKPGQGTRIVMKKKL